MAQEAGDPNMAFALSLAIGLGTLPGVPDELTDIVARARLVHRIDGPLLGGADQYEMAAVLAQRLRAISHSCREEIQSVSGELNRISVALRLWSGL